LFHERNTTVAKAFAVLALVLVGFTFWAQAPHSPNLLPDRAASLIAARPEFNRCYSAMFTFRQNGSPDIIKARAEFRYYGSKWHLADFWWGELPHVQSVHVGHDSDVVSR
jgi:hypothetical protein